MPSTDVEVRRPANEVVATIRDNDQLREQLQTALPVNVTFGKFVTALQTALIDDAIRTTEASKQLVNADRASLFQAVVKCAADGLLPDGREAALVVYSGKVQYLPMIAGIRKIAAEFGWTIRTHVVYANDRFDVVEGTEQMIDHRPAPPGTDRGPLVAAYAVAHHRDGRRSVVEVMRAEDVAKAKSVAKTDKVWKQWPAQMWEKTVGHRIAKKLPLDPQDATRLMRVIEASELDRGQAAELLYGTSSSPTDGEAARVHDPSTVEPGGSQQAEGAPKPSPDAPSAPGPDEDDFGIEFGEPADEPETDPDIAAAQTASTYEVAVPKDDAWVNGLTLAQINARGEDGEKFFRWALGRGNTNAELRAQADAYAKVQLPALWAELAEVA